MITGFFFIDSLNSNNVKKQIKKIVVLIIKANLLYFVYNLAKCIINGYSISNMIMGAISIKSIARIIFLNDSPFGGHLWYLNAILYVMLIVALSKKLKFQNILIKIAPFLLIFNKAIGFSEAFLNDHGLPGGLLHRNFLFFGLPFFAIGMLLREKPNNFIARLSNKKLTVLLLLSTLATVIEVTAYTFFDIPSFGDLYIFNIPTSIILFTIFERYGRKQTHTKFAVFIGSLGLRFSSGIYIVHMMMYSIPFRVTTALVPLPVVQFIIIPILTFFLSLFAVWLIYICEKAIRKKIKKRQI